MDLPTLHITDRRGYPRWLRAAFGASSFIFGVALANCLLQIITFGTRMGWEPIVMIAGFGTVFFTLAALHLIFGRPASQVDQAALGAWAQRRYDLRLSTGQRRRITRAAHARGIPFEGWASTPITHFQREESGLRHLVHLMLLRTDGEYIIFCPEAGGEYPISQHMVAEENQVFMEEAWKEIDEHGGLYILTPEQDYFNGDIVHAKTPQGRDIALVWSDRLRADLWLQGDDTHKGRQWQISYMPLPEAFNNLLPAMIREDQSIGLNWGEGARAYDAGWFTERMGQRFEWLSK